MSVPVAFLTVVVIWSTTPLAVQWSSQGWGYMFGITGRMVLGALICVLILAAVRRRLPLDRKALTSYAAASLGIYGAMMCVYWASQYIPSGLIAVIFGLSPVVTGIVAALLLQENSMTTGKLLGGVFGVVGLWIIFVGNIDNNSIAWQGIVAMLCSVVLHALSAVLVKRINSSLDGFTLTAGGLLFSIPIFLLSWIMLDGNLPQEYPVRSASALLYLGLFGSVIGFSLYFYVLKRVEANKVALVTLITPVTALMLGQWLNHEEIPLVVWGGTAFILLALTLHQWGDYGVELLRARYVEGKKESGY